MSLCQEAEFKRVFTKWQASLQRFALSKSVDAHQVGDLVQDAFLKLWQNCSKVDIGTVGPYLYKMVSNLIIDRYRQTQTRLKHKPDSPTADKQDPQYQMEMKEFKTQLETAINGMTEGSREVFVLHRFDGRSYKEIALLLELSQKAVEKRMHKALLHLSNMDINLKRR